MNGGKVAQIGAPLDVYWQPADTFVARFLGSPPMNLLTVRPGFDARVESEAVQVPLARWAPAILAPLAGKDVVFGVRAEDLHLQAEAAGPGHGRIRGKVFAVEPLGAETLLALEVEGGFECTARLPRDTRADIGDVVDLFFRREASYLFDAGTGKAIAPMQTAIVDDARRRQNQDVH